MKTLKRNEEMFIASVSEEIFEAEMSEKLTHDQKVILEYCNLFNHIKKVATVKNDIMQVNEDFLSKAIINWTCENQHPDIQKKALKILLENF